MFLETVPEEAAICFGSLDSVLMLLIFGFLDKRSLARCACVAGRWHRVAENRCLHLCEST